MAELGSSDKNAGGLRGARKRKALPPPQALEGALGERRPGGVALSTWMLPAQPSAWKQAPSGSAAPAYAKGAHKLLVEHPALRGKGGSPVQSELEPTTPTRGGIDAPRPRADGYWEQVLGHP